MRKLSLTLLVLSAIVLLNACGASTTAQPYTNMQTVMAVSTQVAAHYHETHAAISHVTATLTDGPTAAPMNAVSLDGHFHKGSLVATHLSFSMLANGSKVWAIFATDDQYSSTHTPVWLDDEIAIKLPAAQ